MPKPHAKQSLRVWLRMLASTTMIEKLISTFLRVEFGTTLPRFDVLATLERHGEPISMGQLSSELYVSNGNVTGLISRLSDDRLVTTSVDPNDRRSQRVSLTNEGRELFQQMASRHEATVDRFFASLTDQEMDILLILMTKLRKGLLEEHWEN